MEFNSLKQFGRALCKKHMQSFNKFGQVIKEEKSFKEIDDARTMDVGNRQS
jgi:hypothetical protein